MHFSMEQAYKLVGDKLCPMAAMDHLSAESSDRFDARNEFINTAFHKNCPRGNIQHRSFGDLAELCQRRENHANCWAEFRAELASKQKD